MIGSTGTCSAVREQAPALLHVIAAGLTRASLEAARRLASKETGSPTAQAWHDEAVMIYLRGNMPLAAWAALTAAIDAWQEIFIADAGTMLLALGRYEQGVQFLRCAYETGDRSPYLLEALATGYDKLGKRDDARRTIDEIDSDEIDDPVIDIEKSFLDTGKPPPPPPAPTDELQRCLWMLDKHMGQIVAAVRRRDRLLDELLRTPNGHELNIANFAKLRASFAASVRAISALAGASAPPDLERANFNGALNICMNDYSRFTELDIEEVLDETEHVFFWSNVLAMSPEA
jgi:tetratricopeptide (TPR) repeat protein